MARIAEFYQVREVNERLIRIENWVRVLVRRSGVELEMEIKNMIDLSNIAREVAETKGVIPSVKQALEKLTAKITELSGQISNPEDQAKVDALAAELQGVQDEIAAAVAANSGGGGGGDTGATGSTGASIGGASPTE